MRKISFSVLILCLVFTFADGSKENLIDKFEIKDGMHVLCFGKISVYDKRGQYQLYVEKVEPKGAGALQIAFEQLKEKLRKEKFLKIPLT